MATLGDGKSITTVGDKEIVLTSITGEQFKMKITDMAEAVRQVMSTVTKDKNGLMSYERMNSLNNIDIRRATEGGAGILGEGAGFCFAYDRNTPTSYCLFLFFRESNKAAVVRNRLAGTLELGGNNAVGTSTVIGATDYISFATK